MRAPDVWFPHKVTVTPCVGEGANGATYGTPIIGVRAFVKDQSEVVTGDLGTEEVSRSTVWVDPERMPPRLSKVTVRPGTSTEYEATVIKTSLIAHPAFPNLGKVWLR